LCGKILPTAIDGEYLNCRTSIIKTPCIVDTLPGFPITISLTNDENDLLWCAALTARNEPWITLKRNAADTLAFLKGPVAEVYILKEAEERVGFVMIKQKGSLVGYIQTIAIDEKYRGRGIGEATIHYIEQLIFRSFSNVFLCVSSFNYRAQALYKRLGYETVGVLKDYAVAGHDEILMRKTEGPISEFNERKNTPHK
jgi:ribosomal protein S18 acetylase RimI-like enzyme